MKKAKWSAHRCITDGLLKATFWTCMWFVWIQPNISAVHWHYTITAEVKIMIKALQCSEVPSENLSHMHAFNNNPALWKLALNFNCHIIQTFNLNKDDHHRLELWSVSSGASSV